MVATRFQATVGVTINCFQSKSLLIPIQDKSLIYAYHAFKVVMLRFNC
jgi:hypothetical protein